MSRSLRRVAVAGLVLCAGLAVPTAAHGADWQAAPETASPGGGDASDHSSAMNSRKDIALAWHRGGAVELGFRPAGGPFAVIPLTICVGICLAAGNPDVAVDDAGNALTVWRQGGVQAALRSPDGTVTPLGQLSNGSNVQPPQVVFASDGTAIAAWAEGSNVNGAIRPANGTFGAATPIFQGGAGTALLNLVEPATDGAGTALIAFSQRTTAGSTSTVFVRTARASASGFQPTETVDQDSVTSDSSCTRNISFDGVAVALDAPGNAAIGFTKNVSEFSTDPMSGCLTTNDAEILAARRSQAAGAWTSPTELDSQSLLAALGTWGVAFDAEGEVVVAWTDGNTTRYAVGPPAPASGFSAAQDVPGSGGTALAQVISAGNAGIMLVLARQTAIDYSIRPPEGSFGAPSPATEAEEPNLPLLASDSAGDVSASWTEDDSGDDRLKSLVYDASPPVIAQVNAPPGGEVGQSLAMSASVTDAFTPVSLAWEFGDGATATGTPVSHAYSSPGTFAAKLTATDAAGNASAPASRTLTIAAKAPDPNASDSNGPDFLGPLALSSRTIRAAGRGGSALPSQRRRRRRAPIGTRVTFRLDEAAAVRFTVERAQPGRRVRRRCVRPNGRNRTRRKCTRHVRQRGGFSVSAAAGQTRFRFTGRLNRRKLRPGRYRLVAVAVDASGNTSSPRRAAFRVVR